MTYLIFSFLEAAQCRILNYWFLDPIIIQIFLEPLIVNINYNFNLYVWCWSLFYMLYFQLLQIYFWTYFLLFYMLYFHFLQILLLNLTFVFLLLYFLLETCFLQVNFQTWTIVFYIFWYHWQIIIPHNYNIRT
jgi:hypothetical protein